MIVTCISLPGGWLFYILVLGTAPVSNMQDYPARETVACYNLLLGNTNVYVAVLDRNRILFRCVFRAHHRV